MSEIIEVPLPLASVRRLMSFLTCGEWEEQAVSRYCNNSRDRFSVGMYTFQISMFFSASFACGWDMIAAVWS